MIGSIQLGPENRKPYDVVSDAGSFHQLMQGYAGSKFIISHGRDEINGHAKYVVYALDREGVTLLYNYRSLGSAEIELYGPRKSISKVKKKLRDMLQS